MAESRTNSELERSPTKSTVGISRLMAGRCVLARRCRLWIVGFVLVGTFGSTADKEYLDRRRYLSSNDVSSRETVSASFSLRHAIRFVLKRPIFAFSRLGMDCKRQISVVPHWTVFHNPIRALWYLLQLPVAWGYRALGLQS